MSKLRSVNTSIWTDVWFESLDINKKLLFIYLITNEKTNMLGVYEISLRKISFETSIPADIIKDCFDFFEKEGKIKYKCDRVILIKYIKHQNYNTNMKKSAIDCYNELPNELKIKENHILTRDNKGFETLYNGFLSLRKVEVEVEDEIEVKVEDEVEEKKPDDDSYFNFDDLRLKYLQNDKIVKAVCNNQSNNITENEIEKRLTDFNTWLTESGEGLKTFKDYCKHFLSWHKKNKTFKAPQSGVKRNFL